MDLNTIQNFYLLLKLIEGWWWLPLPFILWKPFLYLWLWWRREMWLRNVFKPILLEIKIPKDIVKPIKAMEDAMQSLHGVIYHPPDWWEKWIDGQLQTSLSFEIASIGGEIHFFVRIHKAYRQAVEASIYADYPEAEIVEAEDYTKFVPHDLPNKEWDMWGTDYKFLKENPYPITTYKKFEREEEEVEERKVDPVATLLEVLAKIKPEECFWVQILAKPVTSDEHKWIEEGKKIRDKLAKRPDKPTQRSIFLDAADVLVLGKVPTQEEKKEDVIPPEMKMTPGEKELVTVVEEKISKPGFITNIRFIFLGKRDVFFKGNFRLGFAFFASYANQMWNALVPYGPTLTKVHKSWFLPLNLLRQRRHYIRCRKIFRQYKDRNDPFFPRETPWPVSFILNTEEMASLFHFPSWGTAPVPTVERIESKKGAPPNIPTE